MIARRKKANGKDKNSGATKSDVWIFLLLGARQPGQEWSS
jgi:hypothetical protein